MKILVTGSNGFIGKKLVKELEKRGHEVFGFDISLGKDIKNFQQVKNAVKGVDVVFHLAAVLDEHSKNLFKVNVDGTRNILEASAKVRVKKFIHLSSVGVMGNLKEKANESFPFKPETRYEKSKAEAEKLVLEFQEMLPIIIVRAAVVLGPNKYWLDIVKHVRKGLPFVGKGNNEWQTVFVDDLVNALIFLMEKEEAVGETFIVAEEKPIKLRNLYCEIQKNLGMQVKYKSVPYLLGKAIAYYFLLKSKLTGKKVIGKPAHVDRLVRVRLYDISKIKKLGWKPKFSTKDALKKTLKELGF